MSVPNASSSQSASIPPTGKPTANPEAPQTIQTRSSRRQEKKPSVHLQGYIYNAHSSNSPQSFVQQLFK